MVALRRYAVLAFCLSFGLGAAADKRVTVSQLEQALIESVAAHRSDAEVVHTILSVTLSERLTAASLHRLTGFSPGPETTQALMLLGDQSAFLALPANELAARAAPDGDAQQQMLEAARRYVGQTLSRLPNLFATRTTRTFDDSAQQLTKNGWPLRVGLHQVGMTSREISIANDRDSPAAASDPSEAQSGLVSWGEFGPMLQMILSDTAAGQLTWSAWEQTPDGGVAIFRFAVPRAASHFEVRGFLLERSGVDSDSVDKIRGPAGLKPSLKTSRLVPFRVVPGYHGSMAISPTTGAILRLTVQADVRARSPLDRADLVVEYGPVAIGEQTFLCPVRALAFYQEKLDPNDPVGAAPLLKLNETSFTGYHRFAVTTRILTENKAPK